MTRLLRLCALLIAVSVPVAHGGQPAAAVAEKTVLRLSEPVEATDSYEVFGAPLVRAGQAVSLSQLVREDKQYLDTEVLVTTRVAKVCQKKGCFFIAQDGDAVARVTFKDYEFFIPTDSANKQVTLSGTFTRRELTAEQAGHYRKDLGESGAEAPPAKSEYLIVASSVLINRD